MTSHDIISLCVIFMNVDYEYYHINQGVGTLKRVKVGLQTQFYTSN